jgi:hypothetical protein
VEVLKVPSTTKTLGLPQNSKQMLPLVIVAMMAYGVRRNEANGDCPGFRGDGVCEWGATRQSDGHGRAPRPRCKNCMLEKSPPQQPNKRHCARPTDGEQQAPPRPPSQAPTNAFSALNGTANSPRPDLPGRPATGTHWDGERHAHSDANTHAAWAFNNRRDGGSRHYQMFDESWTTDSHGWVRSQKMTDLLVDGKCKTERTEGACLGCVQCSRLFCSLCKHEHTSQFSLSQGGSQQYKKGSVLDHCKKKHPVQTETRNLAAMFVDGMRNEKVRVVNLIKLALTLATEALPSSKFPTFCDLLWHLNLGHCRAKGPAGI